MVPGYKKIDLHIHTTRSACYEDYMSPHLHLNTQPEDIIEGAIAAGLDAIAITDHNCALGVEDIRRVAGRNGLHIFPGMEITARGGHVLAIFDEDTPISLLNEFLEELGFTPDQYGDAFFETKVWIDEVFRMVAERGGLSVASHIDRWSRGFIASGESRSDKLRIHNSEYLSAMEITDPRDKARWSKGLMPHFPRPRPCVQGSDAHAPKEMGRRPTYLDVPRADFDGLRLAFREYATRIWFPHELEDWPEPLEG